MSEYEVNRAIERIVEAYTPKRSNIQKIVDEVVESVNSMTWEQSRAAESAYRRSRYGTDDTREAHRWGYRSFWD